MGSPFRRTAWGTVLLLLTAAIAAGRNASKRPLHHRPDLETGVLFRDKGPLVIATGAWTLVVRLADGHLTAQESVIRRDIDQISEALARLEASARTANYSTGQAAEEGGRREEFVGVLAKIWERERTWMEHEMLEARKTLEALQYELRASRKQRGLINFVGEGLSWLFGTTTERETKKLHQELKAVKTAVGELHHVATLQATVLESVSKRTQENHSNIKLLAAKANKLIHKIDRVDYEGRSARLNIRHELDLSNTLSSVARTAGAAVASFRHEVQRLARAMADTQHGALTPDILPPRLLQKLLHNIRKHLPEGWSTADPRAASPADIYRILDAQAVPLRTGWEVHVRVPLQHTKYANFGLKKAVAIPTHFINTSAALVTELQSEYLAISEDYRLHFEMTREDLAHCRVYSLGTVCYDFTPLVREARTGCLYSAYRGDIRNTDKFCIKRIASARPNVFPISGDSWVYTLPVEETFRLRCSSGRQEIIKIQGTGLFSLPYGCIALGDHFIIPAHLKTKIGRPQNISVDDIKSFSFNLDMATFASRVAQSNAPEVDEASLIQLIEGVSANSGDQVALADITTRLQEWNEGPSWADGLAEPMPLSLGVATVVLLVTTVAGCIYVKRGKQRQTGTHEDPPPAQPVPDHGPTIAAIVADVARLGTTTAALEKRLDNTDGEVEKLARLL